jgi:hypothetical protein
MLRVIGPNSFLGSTQRWDFAECQNLSRLTSAGFLAFGHNMKPSSNRGPSNDGTNGVASNRIDER